jgi:hypothetical protein
VTEPEGLPYKASRVNVLIKVVYFFFNSFDGWVKE